MSETDRILWDVFYDEDLFCIWGIAALEEPLKDDIVESALKHLVATVPMLNIRPELDINGGKWRFVDKKSVADLIVKIKTQTDDEADAHLKKVFENPIDPRKMSMIRLTMIDGPSRHCFVIQVHHIVVDGEGLKRICVKFAEIYRALFNDKNWKPSAVANPDRSLMQIARQLKLRRAGLVAKACFLKIHEITRAVLLKRMNYNLIGDFEIEASDTSGCPYFEGIVVEKDIMRRLKTFTENRNYTVNDVLMASFSLATKEWNTARGDSREWLKFMYTANMRRWWGEPDGTFGNYSVILIFEEMNENLADPATALASVKTKMDAVKKRIGLDMFAIAAQLKLAPSFLVRRFSLWLKSALPDFLRYNHAMTNIGIVFEEAGDFGHTKALGYSLLAPTYRGGCIVFTITTYKNETTIYIGCNEDYLKKESAKQYLELWKKKILEIVGYD